MEVASRSSRVPHCLAGCGRDAGSTKLLSPVLALVLLLVALELLSIQRVRRKSAREHQQYLRFLKAVLQFTENLEVQSGLGRNQWGKVAELTYAVLLRIRAFSEKKQMLVHLAEEPE